MEKDILHEVITCLDCGSKFTLNGERDHYLRRETIDNLELMATIVCDPYFFRSETQELPNKCFECRNKNLEERVKHK